MEPSIVNSMPPKRIYHENENLMHFITLTVIEWIDVFTKPEYFKVIIDSLKFFPAPAESPERDSAAVSEVHKVNITYAPPQDIISGAGMSE